MAGRRDVSPILQKLRDILLQRKNVNLLRYRDDMSPRTQPPPVLPPGPHSKLAANYYYSRDARRLVKPNEVFAEGSATLTLPEGGAKPATAVSRVPGKVYNWDL